MKQARKFVEFLEQTHDALLFDANFIHYTIFPRNIIKKSALFGH